MIDRLFNTGLRLGSLALKMGLTLYMGKYLGLTELGTYGLVTATVAIAIPLVGFRFDYVVSRDVVDVGPHELAKKMRDESVFYGINYFVMTLFFFALILIFMREFNFKTACFTLVLSVLENFSAILTANLISLKKPILSNVLFFIRAALWVIPVVVLGVLYPEYRTADTVFEWWLGGILLSLLMTFIYWRGLPWKEVWKSPVDWAWIKQGVGKSLFVWLGAVGAAAGANVDRFIVEYYLNRDFVGIISFYGSFVVAITALLTSGIFAFSYPHLISLYKQGNAAEFNALIRKMTVQAFMSCGFMCAIIGTAIPMLGHYFDRPEFAEHSLTLWLMLLGTLIKSITESLYYGLYAMHQDKAIWQGSLWILLVSFTCNMALIPVFGFIAIGYSAIISSLFLFAWRIYWFKKHKMVEAAS